MNARHDDKRVELDFQIDFSNGGGLQGRGYRLDIDGDEIDDRELADALVRELGLLMVGDVRISSKRIMHERHRRGLSRPGSSPGTPPPGLVDLSHTVEDGMITYRGLPAPVVCDFMTHEESRSLYAEGTEFHFGRIEMVSNTGTYVDSPFHRFRDGDDLSQLGLERLADLDALVVRVVGMRGRSIGRSTFVPYDVRDKAVLIHTGWDLHWRTDRYFDGHPHLTGGAAALLAEQGTALVGIDSLNVDDTAGGHRPVHTTLLGAGIPIVEHLRGLDALPTEGARFTAAPVKVRGFGTFPVRAFAVLPRVPEYAY